MPKNASTRILKRWRAMDAELMSVEGLHVARFARQWRVSTKTVQRDLGAFEELGQKTHWEQAEDRRYFWFYDAGVEYLFLCNIPLRARAAAEAAMKRRRSSEPD